eukprot:6969357-Prymnesium_polylepis.1
MRSGGRADTFHKLAACVCNARSQSDERSVDIPVAFWWQASLTHRTSAETQRTRNIADNEEPTSELLEASLM